MSLPPWLMSPLFSRSRLIKESVSELGVVHDYKFTALQSRQPNAANGQAMIPYTSLLDHATSLHF